jgi:hypothetical protein
MLCLILRQLLMIASATMNVSLFALVVQRIERVVGRPT